MQQRNHGIREWLMSVVGAASENICSFRVFRILTHKRREGLPKRLAVSGLHGAAPRRTTFGMTLMLRGPLWARPTHVMKLGPIGIADSFDQPVPARHDCIQPRAKRRP